MARIGALVATEPYRRAVAVTKSDVTVIPHTDAIYIGGDGDLVVTMDDGNEATFVGMVAGTGLELRVTQVKDATTATNILALYLGRA